jgi:hypothetical protein
MGAMCQHHPRPVTSHPCVLCLQALPPGLANWAVWTHCLMGLATLPHSTFIQSLPFAFLSPICYFHQYKYLGLRDQSSIHAVAHGHVLWSRTTDNKHSFEKKKKKKDLLHQPACKTCIICHYRGYIVPWLLRPQQA